MPVERFAQRQRRREFGKVNYFPNAGHLGQFVEESPIGRVLPHFETQENDVLMKGVPSFRELRRAASDSSPSQVKCLLNEPEYPRLREGFHLVGLPIEPVNL